MPNRSRWAIAIAIVALERPAEADEAIAPSAHTGAELAIGISAIRPSLRDATFHGSGTSADAPHGAETYRHVGREIGIDAPSVWAIDATFRYAWEPFAIGVTAFYGAHLGTISDPPDHPLASRQVDRSALTGEGLGLELTGIFRSGYFAFRPQVVAGFRAFFLPIDAFEPTTCSGKGGSHPCPETAATNGFFFLQPRLRVEVTPGARSVLSFGAYGGMDIVGGLAPAFGVSVSVHFPATRR